MEIHLQFYNTYFVLNKLKENTHPYLIQVVFLGTLESFKVNFNYSF